MQDEKKGKYTDKMVQVYTTIPEHMSKAVELEAKAAYIRPTDIYRRYIMEGYKEKLKP